MLLRFWPGTAVVVGAFGLALAVNFTTFVVSALLVLGGVALELAGWADGVRIHGRRLRRAALIGGLVGAVVVGLLEWRQPPAADPDEGRIALR